jgi:hypothetical protein
MINTAADISLSPERHQDTDVLIFRKDIDGDMTVLTEVHAGKGYILVSDCWRRNKRRNRATGKSPSANVQNGVPPNPPKGPSDDGI